MYRKKDDVERLVLSLSKAEKADFKANYEVQNNPNDAPMFYQLYNKIILGKSQLPKSLSENNTRALTSAKRRLYDNVMKGLRALHDSFSVDIIIQNRLTEIELLYNHSLPEQGLILIRKAHELASLHEKFGLLLQILEWEKRLNIVMAEHSRSMDEIAKEEKEVLKKMNQVLVLESLYSKINIYKKKYGYAKGDIKVQLESEVVNSPDLPPTSSCLSNKAVYYRNYIFSLYNWMTFAHPEAYKYSKKLLLSNINNILPSDYIGGILQHITSSVCVGHFNDALFGIKHAMGYIEEHKLNQSSSFRGLMFAYKSTYRIVVYSYMGKSDKLKATIKDTENKFSEFKNLPREMLQIIKGNLMNAYMVIGEYDKSDEMWGNLFNKQSKSIRLDMYADLYLFRLFRLMQDKIYDLVPSSALSAVRFFRKSKDAPKQFEIELPIALILQKERHYEDKKILQEVMEEIKEVVQKFIDGLTDLNNFQEHYSRYLIWSDAIINDEPYYLAAMKWYEGYSREETK